MIKLSLFLFILMSSSSVVASNSETVTEADLYGIWVERHPAADGEVDGDFILVFDELGNGKLHDSEDVFCPATKIKNVDDVLHISCYVQDKYEIFRIVVAGWKSKKQTRIFGFYYRLTDTEKTTGDPDWGEPEKYRIFDGIPLIMVKSE